ncbi:MAG: class I SAM-dependent methyltransferase [Bauldia sp.]|nr:class I SAM-dependent methyltransferase [Bauldia sp.]
MSEPPATLAHPAVMNRPPELSFAGMCTMCGNKGTFSGVRSPSRESFPCPSCRATLRYREQAGAILSVFSHGRSHFLDHFRHQPECQRLAILEAAIRGPFIRRFKDVPGYVRSYYFEDAVPGETRDGVICQDLERMTFADASFDLIITSDVMEHVFDVDAVIAETARVLRPGGAHIFSVPMVFPLRPGSTARARRGPGGVEHLAEPRYHRSGLDEPSLVVTDFGADLAARHAERGLRARFHRSMPLTAVLNGNAVVVARRPLQ